MGFKNLFSSKILLPSLVFILLAGALLWRMSCPSAVLEAENDSLEKATAVKPLQETAPDVPLPDDAEIQQQLDHDRKEQKQTKYLKTKLEQTNLELEQEKALAEINKLKMENTQGFKEPASDEQKNMPEIRVEYIGGGRLKKEAILSIAGVNFQVKEKSSPVDNIQVVSISENSVTLHFSAPENLTKTIDYKPE